MAWATGTPGPDGLGLWHSAAAGTAGRGPGTQVETGHLTLIHVTEGPAQLRLPQTDDICSSHGHPAVQIQFGLALEMAVCHVSHVIRIRHCQVKPVSGVGQRPSTEQNTCQSQQKDVCC